jgi:hypothetical protein
MPDWKNVPLVSVDLECAGCDFTQHWMVAMGISVRNKGQITKQLFKFHVPCFPDKEFRGEWGWEERCWNEFWSKLPAETIDTLRFPETPSGAVPEEHKAGALLCYQGEVGAAISHLRTIIEELPEKPILVCDTCAFDITWVDYFNLQYMKTGRPMQYSDKWGYTSLYNVNDMARVFDKKLFDEAFTLLDEKKEFQHSHLPDEDAAFMLHKFEVVTKFKEAMSPYAEAMLDTVVNRKRKAD